MFCSIITSNSNWEILTKNLVTFKNWNRLRMKNFDIRGLMKNTIFWGEEFTKNQYVRGIPSKGGLGQFADLRGPAWRKRGGCFWGGWYPSGHYKSVGYKSECLVDVDSALKHGKKYAKIGLMPREIYLVNNINIKSVRSIIMEYFEKVKRTTAPTGIYFLKLTIETSERCRSRRSDVIIVNLEQISFVVLLFPLLTLSK